MPSIINPVLSAQPELPHRFRLPPSWKFILYALALAFFVWSLRGAELSLSGLFKGIPNMVRLIGEMSPPDLKRLPHIARAIVQTFQIICHNEMF
ncbi:MAG: hypothetical protein PVI60_00065 [Desulfobacteraceae bacterium]|jgi:phosphonate transport system permease protein